MWAVLQYYAPPKYWSWYAYGQLYNNKCNYSQDTARDVLLLWKLFINKNNNLTQCLTQSKSVKGRWTVRSVNACRTLRVIILWLSKYWMLGFRFLFIVSKLVSMSIDSQLWRYTATKRSVLLTGLWNGKDSWTRLG